METGEFTNFYTENRTWGIANDNPVEVPDANLVLWLRADKDVYTNTGFSTSATATGNTIAGWKDQSVQVNNFVQSTGSQRPIYRDATDSLAVNFHPTLAFDGVDDHMYRSTFFTNTTGHTVFAVGRINKTSSSWNTLFQQDPTNGNNPMFGIYDNVPYLYDLNSTPSFTRSADTIPYDTANIFGFEWGVPATNSGYTSSVNGARSLTDDILDMGFGTSTLQLSDDTVEGWDGQMSEVIVYKEVLSQTNRGKIESYLAIKYGTTLSQNGSVLASSSHSAAGITATNTGSI